MKYRGNHAGCHGGSILLGVAIGWTILLGQVDPRPPLPGVRRPHESRRAIRARPAHFPDRVQKGDSHGL